MNFLFVYFIPLVIQVLDKQFVFRRDFRVLRSQYALFFLQTETFVFPFHFFGRTFHHFLYMMFFIFLFLQNGFLQIIADDGQFFLYFFATLP